MSDDYDLQIINRETDRQKMMQEHRTERAKTYTAGTAVIIFVLAIAYLIQLKITEPEMPPAPNLVAGTYISCVVEEEPAS